MAQVRFHTQSIPLLNKLTSASSFRIPFIPKVKQSTQKSEAKKFETEFEFREKRILYAINKIRSNFATDSYQIDNYVDEEALRRQTEQVEKKEQLLKENPKNILVNVKLGLEAPVTLSPGIGRSFVCNLNGIATKQLLLGKFISRQDGVTEIHFEDQTVQFEQKQTADSE